MTAPYLPHSAPRKSAADRWEELVASGLSPDAATARVSAEFKMAETPKTRVGLVDAALDVGNEMLQGASFGMADEAAGLLSDRARDAMRERSETFNARNPKSAFVAQMLGGALTGGAAAKGLASGASKVLPGALARAVTSTAGQGAVFGGTTAAGSAEGDAMDRLKAGTVGAVGGAVAAPIIGAATKGIMGTGAALARRLADTRAGQAVANVLPASAGNAIRGAAANRQARTSDEGRAFRFLARNLQRDQVTPDALAQEVSGAAADDPRFLLNVGKRATQMGAKVTQNIPSTATDLVPQRLTTQNQTALDRVEQRLEKAVGGLPADNVTRTKALKREAAAAAKPLYDAIRGVVVKPDDVADLLELPAVQEALTAARYNAANRGQKIADDEMTVGLFDSAKKILDKRVRSYYKAEKAGTLQPGAESDRAGGWDAARRAIVEKMDDLTGGAYKQARDVARGKLQSVEAYTEGYKAPAKNLTEVKTSDARTNDPKRYAEGYATRVRDKMREARERGDGWRDVTRNLFDSDAERQKMTAAIGDPALESQFQLERKLRADANASMLPAGSQTTPVGTATLDATGGNVPGLVSKLAQLVGNPARALAMMGAEKGARFRGLNEKAAGLAGDLLTTRLGEQRPDIQRLVAFYLQQERDRLARQAAARAVSGVASRAIGAQTTR